MKYRLIGFFLWSWAHPLISWYLRVHCGGAFHVHPYGPKGRYVVLMTEDQHEWHETTKRIR